MAGLQEATGLADLVPADPDEVTVADLCEDGSEFIGVGSLNVHYKIAYPQVHSGHAPHPTYPHLPFCRPNHFMYFLTC